jgi:hypothetical protein
MGDLSPLPKRIFSAPGKLFGYVIPAKAGTQGRVSDEKERKWGSNPERPGSGFPLARE